MLLNLQFFAYMAVRGQEAEISKTIDDVRKVWERHNTEFDFDYAHLNDRLDKMYTGEQQTVKVMSSFTLLAILLAVMGLFGLSTFAAEGRTREIGVRKVVGATELNIILMLTIQFLKWVFIATLFAFPIAWIICDRWLESFAYHIGQSAGHLYLHSYYGNFCLIIHRHPARC